VADFERETAPEVYSKARERASHLSDYRALPGSAFQFSWLVRWVDGQSTINVASMQPNAAIDVRGLRNPHRPR
jgi:hypothetical protein